ncbi:MAG: methylmalonyl Co-A mutase-associated GTPase MeaB [Saprospiraceae bacterium]|nr:methylmalonyl Co-A mutase-associated GTPase MeaB [Saprospiraceae bacterium]
MSVFNPDIQLSKWKLPDVNELYQQVVSGNRFELSRAITLIESEAEENRESAERLVNMCLQNNKQSLRIGISGAPGASKSSLLESLGMNLIAQNMKPAVLTVDPSSGLSSGSILGDKTRMQELSNSPQSFIRTSPAGNTLGGVGKYSRESIIIVENAGFDPVFIETVGVGQSETDVAAMTDLFILILQPGSGDELQGIKRGIMELADIIVINKYDSDNIVNAKHTMSQYSGILQYLPIKDNKWERKILMTSAIENFGIAGLWDTVLQYKDLIIKNGYLEENRKSQNVKWFQSIFLNKFMQLIETRSGMTGHINEIKSQILQGSLTPYEASEQLLKQIVKNI